MPPYLQKCLRCPSLFPFVAGKLYCTKRCRNAQYKAERSETDLVLNGLPVITPHQNRLHEFAGQPPDEPLRFLLTSNAPPTAIGFRLGAMRGGNKGTTSPFMRWFPTRRHKVPPVFSLVQWETVDVPFVGSYVVAFFDDEYSLIGLPTFQVEVKMVTRLYTWTSGDYQMAIDPGKLVS